MEKPIVDLECGPTQPQLVFFNVVLKKVVPKKLGPEFGGQWETFSFGGLNFLMLVEKGNSNDIIY